MSHNPYSEKIYYYFSSKIKNLQMQEPFILSMRQESTYHNGLTFFLKEHLYLHSSAKKPKESIHYFFIDIFFY